METEDVASNRMEKNIIMADFASIDGGVKTTQSVRQFNGLFRNQIYQRATSACRITREACRSTQAMGR